MVRSMDHESDVRARRASSFGSQAATYALYRPDYPVALLDWGLTDVRDAADLRVLDLGAGTGKLTGGLVELGIDTVAVEPDPAMLAQLTELFPGVTALAGSAETIPLPDASVHAVFVGQALHWFDLDRALPEIGRVLRPGGSLIAAWNTNDGRVPWVAELSELAGTESWQGEKPDDLDNEFGSALGRFGTLTRETFPHQMVRTVDSLVNSIGTHSAMLVATPEQREARLGPVRRYLLANPLTAQGEFAVPMVTMAMKITPG
jgi:SAM-dependent methyltransferase